MSIVCNSFPMQLSIPCYRYFLQQNAAIASGSISGVPINLKVLGVGDGLTVSYPRIRSKSCNLCFVYSRIP